MDIESSNQSNVIDGRTPAEWLDIAFKHAGGPSAISREFSRAYEKITPQAVAKWKITGLPANWVIPMEKLVMYRVKRHQLSPVIYPPSEYAA